MQNSIRLVFCFLCRAIIVTILLVIFDLICVKVGFLLYLKILLSKVGFFLGDRAISLFLLKLGCSDGLSLAIGFAVKALLTSGVEPNMMKNPSDDSSSAIVCAFRLGRTSK